MLYNRCTGIYKFGNNTYPRRIRSRSNWGHIFREKSTFYGPGNTVIGKFKWSYLPECFLYGGSILNSQDATLLFSFFVHINIHTCPGYVTAKWSMERNDVSLNGIMHSSTMQGSMPLYMYRPKKFSQTWIKNRKGSGREFKARPSKYRKDYVAIQIWLL